MISTTLKKVESTAEQIRNDKPQLFPVSAVEGDYFRQGDIYIWKRDSPPKSVTLDKEPSSQLAPGTTKGSRHILDSLEGVEVYSDKHNKDVLQGPYLKISEERTVTHPEHGNVIIPSGIYEITYQLAYGEQRRRVLD